MSFKEEDEYAAVLALANLGNNTRSTSPSIITQAASVSSIDDDDDDDSEAEPVEHCGEPNAKFPLKLFDILEDDQYSDIIQWLPQGNGFFFVDKKRFEAQILPLFFKKRTKFTSFTRRLVRWGFVRVARGSFLGSYFHSLFQKGQRSLCVELCNRLRNKKVSIKNLSSKAQLESNTSCTKDALNTFFSMVSKKPVAHPQAVPVRPHEAIHRQTQHPADKDALLNAYYAHKGKELKKLLVLRLIEHKRQQLMLQNQYMQMANVHNQQRLLALLKTSTEMPGAYPHQPAAVPFEGHPSFSNTNTWTDALNRNTFGAHAA